MRFVLNINLRFFWYFCCCFENIYGVKITTGCGMMSGYKITGNRAVFMGLGTSFYLWIQNGVVEEKQQTNNPLIGP